MSPQYEALCYHQAIGLELLRLHLGQGLIRQELPSSPYEQLLLKFLPKKLIYPTQRQAHRSQYTLKHLCACGC